MKIICPRCCQDYLIHAKIKATGEIVLVCDECEALWTEDQNPSVDYCYDMRTFLESKGIEACWESLEYELIN
jgi:hypothetical protein